MTSPEFAVCDARHGAPQHEAGELRPALGLAEGQEVRLSPDIGEPIDADPRPDWQEYARHMILVS
jgi:hypothetical protein